MGKCTLLNLTGNRRVFLPKPVHAYIMNIDPFIFFEYKMTDIFLTKNSLARFFQIEYQLKIFQNLHSKHLL